MKKNVLIIIAFFIITNCTLNKVIKHHGVHFLEKKQSKLNVNTTNKKDILVLLLVLIYYF